MAVSYKSCPRCGRVTPHTSKRMKGEATEHWICRLCKRDNGIGGK
jgi:hypothetical protein